MGDPSTRISLDMKEAPIVDSTYGCTKVLHRIKQKVQGKERVKRI